MHTISSVNDIATYLQNNHPDLLDFDLVTPAVAAIQAADHPRWGSDWSEWLGEHARAIVEEVASANGWTYEGYWNTVLGAHSDAARIVAEYDLAGATKRGLDEWLGGAESDAWAESGRKHDERPASWRGFHRRALAELVEAAEAAEAASEES